MSRKARVIKRRQMTARTLITINAQIGFLHLRNLLSLITARCVIAPVAVRPAVGGF